MRPLPAAGKRDLRRLLQKPVKEIPGLVKVLVNFIKSIYSPGMTRFSNLIPVVFAGELH